MCKVGCHPVLPELAAPLLLCKTALGALAPAACAERLLVRIWRHSLAYEAHTHARSGRIASTQPCALLCWMLDVEVVISVYLILALFSHAQQ